MPTLLKAITLSELDQVRFWGKVTRNGPVMPGMETPCWPWTAGKRSEYGAFQLHGENVKAHRVAFLLGGGVFTDEKPQANHRCRNRLCCNPGHIYAGDQLENVRDMDAHGTLSQGEKHGNVKLTDEQCAYVRSSALSQRAIARELGVGPTQIGNIRSGRARLKPSRSSS